MVLSLMDGHNTEMWVYSQSTMWVAGDCGGYVVSSDLDIGFRMEDADKRNVKSGR